MVGTNKDNVCPVGYGVGLPDREKAALGAGKWASKSSKFKAWECSRRHVFGDNG
jgi:hypothetical protein